LKECRKACGYTLLEVAQKLGITEATMQRYESGEIRNIKHETIVNLADIYGVAPAYLMGWEVVGAAIDEIVLGRVILDELLYALYIIDHGKDLEEQIILDNVPEPNREKIRLAHRIVTLYNETATKENRDLLYEYLMRKDKEAKNALPEGEPVGDPVWQELKEIYLAASDSDKIRILRSARVFVESE